MDKDISASEIRKAYLREWRAKNKDRVKQYNERYWQRKAEELQKKSRGGKNA